jgi:hypothetical protein
MSSAAIDAVLNYLCRHKSVGVFRLVDDVAKTKEVRQALRLEHAPAPGTQEWWRVYHAVMDAVRKLEAHKLVKYLSDAGVVNWTAGGCA